MSQKERRHQRSVNTTRALCYQLRASLKRARLDGLVLADEDGVCLAAAGDDEACDEIAAHLPMMGRKVGAFEGVLFGPSSKWDIHMRGFQVDGSKLFLCAIGENSPDRQDQIEHSISGVSRILLPIAA